MLRSGMLRAAQTHAVSAIKCICGSLLFNRYCNDKNMDIAPVWKQRAVSSSTLFGVSHETRQDQQVSPPPGRAALTTSPAPENVPGGASTAAPPGAASSRL